MRFLDCIAKFLALLILAVLAFTYWQKRDNGRYMYHHGQATADSAEFTTLLDSRTGTIYSLAKDGGDGVSVVEVHPLAGTFSIRKFTKSN